jgi:hypothetical protein
MREYSALRAPGRVREIMPAAIGQRLQVPIPLDEFLDRDV